MTAILASNSLTDPNLAGNKAAVLADLARAGFDVPPFFVIRPAACTVGGSPSESPADVVAAARQLGNGHDTVAVRSSSLEEDGCEASFAGQFATFLNVAPDAVPAMAARVAASGDAGHVGAYRESRGLGAAAVAPAVLVQRMVRADRAGVAFAADPVTGSPEQAVVAAVAGTGDALVGGERQGDTWRVDRSGRILESALEGGAPVMTDADVKRVAELARAVSRFRGRPQDIEWAIESGRLFLLQARDITAGADPRAAGKVRVWDNSNIVESYGGVTTPLTFSVARTAYAAAYRHLGRVIGVGEKTIADHEADYEQMIGLVRGRVYYNLVSWYRLLMLVPGFRHNRRFMEQMMGVTDGLPAGVLPEPARPHRFSGLLAASGMLRVGWRLMLRLIGHRRAVVAFHRRMDELLQPENLSALPLETLADRYLHLQRHAIRSWHAPLLNDLYCMIFHGLLRRLCEAWLPHSMASVHNELVAGESGIISLEPVRYLYELADFARGDEVLCTALLVEAAPVLEKQIASRPEFARSYREYLARFGDRCLDELKLESRTLNDDPLPFLRTVGRLATAANTANRPDGNRGVTEAETLALIPRGWRRSVFRRVLQAARARVRDRENMRFERTRVYGRVRALFVEIGRRFARDGVLRDAGDIFYLDATEIIASIRGNGVCGRPGDVAAARQSEFDDYAKAPSPPRRFVTEGPPQFESAIRAAPPRGDTPASDLRTGQACSRGVARGRVRIVTDPRAATVEEGDILVAERTDPGWVTIFPLVTGMVMERGSLLSHSAIVARELGIPAVVGVEDACRWLKDGDLVEVDGAAGTVRRIAEEELPA